MEFLNLGATAVKLPLIGFGTWRYSGGIAPLQAAIDSGASFVDAAESYGSEEVVGEAIQGFRSHVIVATKASPRHFRYGDLITAAEQSLRRLRTDYIDLYQLHWPNYTVPIYETMSAMEQLVRAGKIRFIGLSNFSVRELKQAQACLSTGRIVSNQVRYSLIDRTPEQGMLEYCQQNQITLIAFSPLGADFSQIKRADRDGILANIAKRFQKTEAQIALNWLIAKKNVVTIPKASSASRAVENAKSCGWRLPEEEYEVLASKIQFSRRGSFEAALRRQIKHIYQIFGREL